MLALGEITRRRALPFVQRCCAGSDKWWRVRSELGWPAVATLHGAAGGRAKGRQFRRLFGSLALVMSQKSSYLCHAAAGRLLGSATGIIAAVVVVASVGETVFGVASLQVGTRRERINSQTRLQKKLPQLALHCFCAAAVSGIDIQLPPNQWLDYSVKVIQPLITDFSFKDVVFCRRLSRFQTFRR